MASRPQVNLEIALHIAENIQSCSIHYASPKSPAMSAISIIPELIVRADVDQA